MPLGETATAPSGSVGVMASACLEEEIDRNTGSPMRWEVVALNENSVRSRLGRVGWRTGSYYCGSRVMLVEERSLTSGVLLEETNSPEIGFAYQLH